MFKPLIFNKKSFHYLLRTTPQFYCLIYGSCLSIILFKSFIIAFLIDFIHLSRIMNFLSHIRSCGQTVIEINKKNQRSVTAPSPHTHSSRVIVFFRVAPLPSQPSWLWHSGRPLLMGPLQINQSTPISNTFPNTCLTFSRFSLVFFCRPKMQILGYDKIYTVLLTTKICMVYVV